jgi:hypothetical protein
MVVPPRIVCACVVVLLVTATPILASELPPSTANAAAPTASLDQSTPKALLRSFFASRGEVDEVTLRSLMYAATPTEQKVLDSVVQIELANGRLRAAERERFGGATTGPSVASSRGLDVDTLEDIAALTERVEGDRAVIGSPMDPKLKMELVRVDGRWMLPMSSHAGGSIDAALADSLAATTRAQVEIIDALTADVRAGKFAGEEQVRQELARRQAERLASATRPASQSATQPAGT